MAETWTILAVISLCIRAAVICTEITLKNEHRLWMTETDEWLLLGIF